MTAAHGISIGRHRVRHLLPVAKSSADNGSVKLPVRLELVLVHIAEPLASNVSDFEQQWYVPFCVLCVARYDKFTYV